MKFSKSALKDLAALVGVELNSTSHTEKLIATAGALLGILAVVLVSQSAMGGASNGLLVTSMGASAVLLFVVPHGALSQPWPVLGGHMLSAGVGVSCQLLFPGEEWTPALAVCLSIAAMQYLRCVHPPGGATALAAVVGGADTYALGYWFLVNPVFINLVSILAIALVFNNLFPWRLYPAHLMKRKHAASTASTAARQLELTQEDFEAAMHKMNTFIDVSTDDLIELVDLARQHAEEHRAHPQSILLGHTYSNGRLGRFWSVRQVIDAGIGTKSSNGKVIYKIVAGDGAWNTGICGYEEFRQWARFEVVSREGRWIRQQEAA